MWTPTPTAPLFFVASRKRPARAPIPRGRYIFSRSPLRCDVRSVPLYTSVDLVDVGVVARPWYVWIVVWCGVGNNNVELRIGQRGQGGKWQSEISPAEWRLCGIKGRRYFARSLQNEKKNLDRNASFFSEPSRFRWNPLLCVLLLLLMCDVYNIFNYFSHAYLLTHTYFTGRVMLANLVLPQ